jgi:predicted DNA-binding transcriptional regulator AlpA
MTASSSKGAGRQRLASVGLPPRGLDRLEASAYIGVSPGTFDDMVADGRMPQPREINSRRVFDLVEINRAFDSLPHAGGGVVPSVEPDDVWSRARA